MELYPADILIHVINIIVLYILLRVILVKPVSKFLTARTARIEKELLDAEKAKAEADALKTEYEKSLENAEMRADDILAESEEKAAKNVAELLDKAKAEADEIVDRAKAEAADEKRKSILGAHDEIAVIAVDIAERVIDREVTLEDNKKIVDDFFAGKR